MEHVSASGYLGTCHVLITDGAHIRVLDDLLLRGVAQAVDLGHGAPALLESCPAVPCLAPDVEVRVNQHHTRSVNQSEVSIQICLDQSEASIT